MCIYKNPLGTEEKARVRKDFCQEWFRDKARYFIKKI